VSVPVTFTACAQKRLYFYFWFESWSHIYVLRSQFPLGHEFCQYNNIFLLFFATFTAHVQRWPDWYFWFKIWPKILISVCPVSYKLANFAIYYVCVQVFLANFLLCMHRKRP